MGHAGGRGAHDAARHGRRVRGLRHLQVRGPGKKGQGHRARGRPLQRPESTVRDVHNLGKAMVGISDVKGDAVNFRDREGGAKEATAEGIPKKRKLHGHTETQLYGSSWK